MTDAPQLSEQDLEQLERSLSSLEQHLADGDVAGARSALAVAEELAGERDPDVAYGRALIALEEGRLDDAIDELTLALDQDPDFADAHYTLALALEKQGDRLGMVRHFLCTHALDREVEDEVIGEGVLERIEQTVRRTIDGLPPELRVPLSDVPIVLESRPSEDQVANGEDPRALGLFDGPPQGQRDVPQPTRIVLFVGNLITSFAGEELDAEVETTVLHELGHYFGLEEDDLRRLGLE